MIAILILVVVLVVAFLFGIFIWYATGGDKPDEDPYDPNAEPNDLKIKLLKIKDALSTDDSNLTFCSKCNKHMARLYYSDNKPTNEYQCLSCRRTVTLTIR